MNIKYTLLLELTRLVGLCARAVIESNTPEFLSHIHAIRRVCDLAIQQLTFRVIDIPEPDDDEL